MKIIFLDFDGVLVNHLSLLQGHLRWQHGKDHKAAPECVEQLNRIVETTGAKIVVSSMWRLLFTVPELRELMDWWGVKGEVLDRTPRMWGIRGEEIQRWLDQAPDVESFVIIDDNDDMGQLKPFLVQTAFGPGITAADADKCIAMLEAKSEDHSLVR